tara:strand:- start:644 stop:1030 length:387 start_codon:yes stop_codon:yes gene_type:complete
MKDKNPLSPHIQIYSWHISSLLSISHRIIGVINIIVLSLVCFWVASLHLGIDSYEITQNILKTFIGKFFLIGIIWSFCFQVLCELRHLFWDMGYGFEIKISNITGIIVLVGSFVLTITIYLISRNLLQ